MFKGKKPSKMGKYVRVLNGLSLKISKDKKVMRKIFGDEDKYAKFLRDNIEWILEKTKYDFTEDEMKTLMNLLSHVSLTMVRNS